MGVVIHLGAEVGIPLPRPYNLGDEKKGNLTITKGG